MKTEQQALQFFLSIESHNHACIIYHGDADGICAGVMVYRYLCVEKRIPAVAIPLQRGLNPFSDEMLGAVQRVRPDFLIVVDSGSRAGKFPDQIKTIIIDHHVPDGNPTVDVFFNTVLDSSERIASEAVYDIVHTLYPEADLLWYGLVGITGDAGINRIPARFKEAASKYGKKNITETVTLINAARRHRSFRVEETFQILLETHSPHDFIAHAQMHGFRELQQEVYSALKTNLKIKPRFQGRFALILLSSPHQIHPLVAAIWAGNLKNYTVIAANQGYLPGKVSFSMRTRSDQDLLELLKRYRLEGEEIGFGHRKASGGIVDKAVFRDVLRRFGFSGEEV